MVHYSKQKKTKTTAHNNFILWTNAGLFTTASDVESLSEEINKMVQFDHPNVMKLVGVCVVPSPSDSSGGGGSGPCVVMPFMAKGSLLDQLREHSEELTVTDENDKRVSDRDVSTKYAVYRLKRSLTTE